MEKSAVLETIKREKLVPVVRTNNTEDARKAVEILASCGIKIFEITMTVPNATELIRELSVADSGVMLGAGTVLNPEQAEKCVEAEAKFIVSPAFDAETVRYCRDNKIAVMPGCLTPTEVLTAWNAGADCVKVFPCDALGGAKYLKTLKTLFPHIEMMPTGGVSCATIADFFRAGAIGVGVGTDLVDVEAIREGNSEQIAEKAREYLKIVNNT
ncbi:MAG: 4-hydroxy-2-oxoglutarate aldolase @ 2-dehydro-3-deoxyphosphogluconate aldolase [uncultured Pyrinomonadaceae bacterium]|uniref:4-hydroxy-2-oxoglutarate aldolase @ 2-dehydro-3-deoxyphosphogluconate aldolase n=1 Tax=uncultured Pyrinomonadaceae bacterium TaxID=2283094 RepID=A0A6J4NLT3_9BACT|nr:MAG: 4-hydroxy-2-oxoglutarate aldolase @ 2-dehydro-3-deoxyphosphogluconate aldolase [uncultured Pyrinomonadaceae bacterium]